MKSHPKLLATAEEIINLSVHLSTQAMIALDTEFIRESTFFPVMALIQVASETQSWLVDPLALVDNELKPLFDVLTNPKVIKVLHASQADQECLYTNYGIVAAPSFDTAAAASLCGYGDSIGLSKLLKEVLDVNLRKGHARTDWTVRPIQDQLLQYAHADVHFLLPVANKLLDRLDQNGRRAWAFELSARFENKKNYELNAEGIAAKLVKNGRLDRRGYATLQKLVTWREKRVRDIDVPRRRVADDDVLMDLANARPKDLNHLSAFRGLNRGEFKASGQAILDAVKKAALIEERDLPEVPKPEMPEPHEARAIELVQCFIKQLADKLEISARHLVTSDELLPLLRGRFTTVEQAVKAGHLTAGAGKLIGGDLLAIIAGKRALSLDNSQIIIKEE